MRELLDRCFQEDSASSDRDPDRQSRQGGSQGREVEGDGIVTGLSIRTLDALEGGDVEVLSRHEERVVLL